MKTTPLVLACAMLAAALVPLGQAVEFDNNVRPLLELHCVKCHGSDKQKGGLRLDTLGQAVKGGDSGTALTKGDPAKSLLLERISLAANHDDIMPPKGDPLKPAQIETLRQWITDGAAWPSGVTLRAKSAADLAREERFAAKTLRSIEVFPAKVTLETVADSHALVAMATYEDDTTRDITSDAVFRLAKPGIAELNSTQLKPSADGETRAHVSFGGEELVVPVKVKDAAKPRPVSFRLDVMPVFMRAGCNTGSCHGSARGQDGFMLSLFGYDPDGDHHRITRQLSTRRLNLALPSESLIVEKSVEAVPHTGAKRFDVGSPYYNTLVEWIEDGAPNDAKDVAKPTGIEILPPKLLLEGEGSTQQMTVIARYSDGTDRDVTPLVVFQSNNDNSATISPDGMVTANNRGEAFVMARFATFTVGSQVVVIPEGLNYRRPTLVANNYIDDLVYDKLHKLRMTPSDLCSDEAFARRSFLDVTGLLPEPDELAEFLADSNPEKRNKLVQSLLDRKEFTEMWVMKWAELLQIRTQQNNQVSYKATLLYHNWLKDRIANNMPFDKIVQELLSSTGGTFKSPATNFYQIERDTLKVTENVAQVFMGMRIQCAQCHNHPFDRWTMDDYYSFASFFSQIGRKNAEDPREVIVFNRRSGDVKHPVGGRTMTPKFLGGAVPEITRAQDRRAVLATWLASADNPFFAPNLANIIWAHFFGIGIIEPVDDVRVSNPASNPELLAALAKHFTEYNYDFKRLVYDICTSRTYQLATRTNESNAADSRNFAHGRIRRLRAEVLLDVITQVTQTKNKFKGLPLGARAVQIAD
ncbi:MAG: DUF1549 domain-containing protein, partial [Verrucomicrobiota bacterium]|nr:DUF1549 domain-containing protein [Verrucomicrobiota bacterium]